MRFFRCRSRYRTNMAMLPYIEQRAKLQNRLAFGELWGDEPSPEERAYLERRVEMLTAQIQTIKDHA